MSPEPFARLRTVPVEGAILGLGKRRPELAEGLSAHVSNIDKATFRRAREPAQQLRLERALP
jgi:hypothetical protein